MKTVIAVASHKEYPVLEYLRKFGCESKRTDPAYVPVLAGAVIYRTGNDGILPPGFIGDDSCIYDGTEAGNFQVDYIRADNISGKNRRFCELTVLYWLWRIAECDIAGLCHYRRYFAAPEKTILGERKILSGEEAERLLESNDIILPKKRRYFIETNYSHYIHAHHEEDLTLTREIIAERHPEYLADYDEVMKRRSGHRFNMMICRKELLDSYCEWLFDILFELQKRLDISDYSGRDKRVFGFVSERILDVWIMHNGLRAAEVPYIMTERENIPAKAAGMISRKIMSARRSKPQ